MKTHCKNGHLWIEENIQVCEKKDGKINRFCKICSKERAGRWNKNNPKRRKEIARKSDSKRDHKNIYWSREKNAYLKRKYGISLEQYQSLLLKQNGLCAICREPETSKSSTGTIKLLAVDHDHLTNKVRGLLCDSCNRGIGLLKDSILTLKVAISYLEEAKKG